MRHRIEQFKSWEGRAEELAKLAGDILDGMGMYWKFGKPKERLVRHYVQKGVLDPPVKRGREARFGYRQLLQFLAAMLLKNRGFSLQLIRASTRDQTENELLKLLGPSGEEAERKTEAQKLVDAFAAAAQKSPELSKTGRPGVKFPPKPKYHLPPPEDISTGTHSYSGRNGRVTSYGVGRCVVLKPASWCRVYVDEKDLAMQPLETLHHLVGVFSSMIQAEWQRLQDQE